MAYRLIQSTLNSILSDLIKAPKIWVAYSGGIDSSVLLHSLTQIRFQNPQLSVNAIHIHHNLLPQANQWAEHCHTVCRSLNINCEIIRLKINHHTGESLEAEARKARYEAFEHLLNTDEILLTAHNLDDQAETCLLQFLRGSGPKGLASMPNRISLSKGFLLRPFLSISRQSILDYAKFYAMNWIEDDSNHDCRFSRNFLRHQAIPLLKERWPSLERTIQRVAHHCSEVDTLLQEIANNDIKNILGTRFDTLSIMKLSYLSPSRQKNALRHWIVQRGFSLPNTANLQKIMTELISAHSDSEACVCWKGVEIRRYRDDLYAINPNYFVDKSLMIHWDLRESLTLPNQLGILSSDLSIGFGLKADIKKVNIRFRKGGEILKLRNRGHHVLKKLFQEWKVPPWERAQIPLVYVGEEIAAVIGYAIDEKFLANDNETSITIKWNRKIDI